MNQYFYEDQVYTVDKKGSVKFGLVVENEVILGENPFYRTFFLTFLNYQFFHHLYR